LNGIAQLREIPLRLLRALITELLGSKIPLRWNYSMYNIHDLDFEVDILFRIKRNFQEN